MQELEIWKELKDLPGYHISNYGNIIGRRGTPYKANKNHKGYLMFRQPDYNYGKSIHRLVAEYFLESFDPKLQVNHKDGNKLNNHVSNLECLTCKENIQHAIRSGLRTAISNLQSNAMFSETDVKLIKYAIKEGFTNGQISKYYKCDHTTISKIRVGKHYPHISI